MTEPALSGCSLQTSFGGLTAADFSALDVLAVKLHCLDSRFATPLRQIAVVFGNRMATETGSSGPIGSEEALAKMLRACGFPSSLESRFLLREANEAHLQITGCDKACCPIPRVDRTVCGFNAGVFEGFLRAATGQPWTVEETACLGLGDASCEFRIRVRDDAGGEHGRR